MSFRLGRVKITLGFYFFMTAALFLALDSGGATVLFLAAAALHELGHLTVIWAMRLPVSELRLCCPSLGLRLDEAAALTPLREAALHLAGCAANAAAGALLLLPGTEWAARFSAVNTALCLAQLLPIAGLDGGSALCALLCAALGQRRGYRAAPAVCRVFAAMGFALSLWAICTYGASPAAAAACGLFGWSFFCGQVE